MAGHGQIRVSAFGASLRDIMAATFAASMSTREGYQTWGHIAKDAYELADAMLAVRSQHVEEGTTGSLERYDAGALDGADSWSTADWHNYIDDILGDAYEHYEREHRDWCDFAENGG